MPYVRPVSPVGLLPHRLASAPPELRAEFDRFVDDLRATLVLLSRAPIRMPPLEPVLASPTELVRARSLFGRVLPIDSTQGDVRVLLPAPQPGDVGGFVGVLRLSTANVVTMAAPDTATIGGLTELVLPTPVRLYLFYYEGLTALGRSGYLPLNDA